MSEPKVTYPVDEVIGFCTSAKAMLNLHKTAMIAKKVDPTDLIAELTATIGDLTDKNTLQENIKTQLRDQTALVQGANSTAYTTGSLACDRLISAFGRTSEEAKEATNLRKGVRPEKSSPPAPPTP